MPQALKLLAEKSYYEFIKQSWHVLNPSEKFKDNWHLKFLCDELQKGIEELIAGKRPKDLIINIPPGSGKSTICTICIAPWVWIHWPEFAHLGVSFADSLSTKHSRESREIIKSEWYQSNWGDVIKIKDDQREKTDFENTKTGRRFACAMSSPTGQHFHLITIDDPHNPKTAESDVERETANEMYKTTLQSRVKDPARCWFVIIMQRLHDRDLTGTELGRSPNRYRHICLPLELTDQVNPPELVEMYAKTDNLLFPARFGAVQVAELREANGITGYQCQYLQSTAPSSGLKIKKWYFGLYDPDSNEIKPHLTAPNYYADTAFGEEATKRKKTGLVDFNSVGCVKAYNGKLYIIDRLKDKLETPAWLRALIPFCERTGYDSGRSTWNIEPKASGKTAVQTMREGIEHPDYPEKLFLNVKELPSPHEAKEVRLNHVLAKIETGKVMLPIGTVPYSFPLEDGTQHTIYVQPWCPDFIETCAKFPKGQHDDDVDWLVYALQGELKGSRLLF